MRIVEDARRVFVLARSGMAEDEIARHLSVAVTLHMRRAWLYVGQIEGGA